MIRCDVLIPTADRPAALAVTLAGLAAQSARLRVVVADQSVAPAADHPAVASLLRALQVDGAEVEVHRRTERRGVAEQRDFLLGRADSAHVLCLDDDVWLRPWAVQTLQDALVELACGFVGMAVVGLSHRDDHRPEQLATFTPWDGDDVAPERIRPGDAAWRRHELHNAANPLHLAELTGATPQDWLAYRVAWIGGCVLYDRACLTGCGGFSFWQHLPAPHAGADVVAQLRVMQRHGGAGILPSGAVHLELPTTIPDRRHQAYEVLGPDLVTP